MKKLTTLLVAFLSASVLFAVESATLNIKIKKGGIESSQYPVKRINENTVRVTIPKSAIPSNYEWFEVLADNAVAMKGEKGFWIISRGEMGTFRCDNGKYTRIPQLPLFGMQNPRETFIGIVRGMQHDTLFYLSAIVLPLIYLTSAMQWLLLRDQGRLPNKLHLLFSVLR